MYPFIIFKVILAGSSLTLKCAVTGKPRPTITWTLDGQPLPIHSHQPTADNAGQQADQDQATAAAAASNAYFNLTDGNQTLFIRRTEQERHSGRYACLAANIGGSASQSQLVWIDPNGGSLLATVYASGIALPVSIAVGVSILLALILLLLTRSCCCCCCGGSRHGRGRGGGGPCGRKWKSPPTPPTPRLTQVSHLHGCRSKHSGYEFCFCNSVTFLGETLIKYHGNGLVFLPSVHTYFFSSTCFLVS